MKYGWEELLKHPKRCKYFISFISGKLINTGRKVKPIRCSERTLYRDENGQEWVKIRRLWWRFPQDIEY